VANAFRLIQFAFAYNLLRVFGSKLCDTVVQGASIETIRTRLLKVGARVQQSARRIVGRFVAPYNEVRLHSAIGYVAPKDRLEGRAESILQGRREKLEAARRRRDRKQPARTHDYSTLTQGSCRTQVAGEMEGSSAGKQLPRDSRPGTR